MTGTFFSERAVETANRLGISPEHDLPVGADKVLSAGVLNHLIEHLHQETASLIGLELITALRAIELLRLEAVDVFQESYYAHYLRELFGAPLSDEATPVAIALLSKLTFAQKESSAQPRLLHELVIDLNDKISKHTAQVEARLAKLANEKVKRLKTIQTLSTQTAFNPLIQAAGHDSVSLNQRSLAQIEAEMGQAKDELLLWTSAQNQIAQLLTEVWMINFRVQNYDSQLDLSHTQDWEQMQGNKAQA